MTRTLFDVDVLVRAAGSIFEAAGIAPGAARRVAESLVDGDARGIPSHGLMLVPMYVDRLRAGSVATHEHADVVLDLGAMAVLDARHALGQLTSDQAMALAVQKAGLHGIGIVSVRHAFHFGGAFRYARQAASAGCIGIVASNTRPLMPAPGGATRVVGNNPVAFGVPRPGDGPVVLDMALSEAALGKIRLAEAEGREIPATWATDASGAATTDPAAAIAGMLLPVGGPKGYGLALMVDVLTGVLSGGAFGASVQGMYADVAVPNNCAHVFIAIDVATFDPDGTFDGSVTELVAQIGASRLAPGTERVLLPGQLEDERAAAALVDGVPVESSVVDGLRGAAQLVGAELPEELA
ncbi:Ldh family oxidoreductase [Aeromicrobium fastidiosum]|uniref:Ldh family oxidoreductase n=1 Tax=Aeromicrobium fastidiosum TaxID=52699 RepID=A0A641ALI5_9ACTN|nr:Ldh family oxidoreductase [Aeromicrobium fastidiosum]KAA1378150.1 Ldh family oxidoreductase [Aeromicrobium fastidiosum]MBP2389048.1 LDH2 family malate/lactate/ureidoglycolate dehydrogenase [Aeromicrobium fastidiosum]